MKKLQGQKRINFATFLLHGVSLQLVSLNISQLWNVQEVFASRRAARDSSCLGPEQKGASSRQFTVSRDSYDKFKKNDQID